MTAAHYNTCFSAVKRAGHLVHSALLAIACLQLTGAKSVVPASYTSTMASHLRLHTHFACLQLQPTVLAAELQHLDHLKAVMSMGSRQRHLQPWFNMDRHFDALLLVYVQSVSEAHNTKLRERCHHQ